MRAVLDGVVTFVGWKGGYGQVIEIRHQGSDMTTRYAHLSRIDVKPGAKVSRGARIALSGTTGLSTGPHLHFELYHRGRVVDPGRYVGERSKRGDAPPALQPWRSPPVNER